MKEFIDLHCHLLPYVDDGAEDLQEALRLLEELIRQGADRICFTPHLREHMFDTPDNVIQRYFAEVKKKAADKGLNAELFVSREYHCDRRFFKLLEKKQLMPMGNGNVVLCEFSHGSEAAFILKTINTVLRSGYTPLVAHVERYKVIHEDEDLLIRMRNAGALIQMNADAAAGNDGFSQKRFCKKILKKKLVDVIASDAHGAKYRPPCLAACADRISKIAGPAYTKKIMNTIPLAILEGQLDRGR